MTEGDREAIRRYVVETMRALWNHTLNIEAFTVSAQQYERLEGSRRAIEEEFAQLDIQFAPPSQQMNP